MINIASRQWFVNPFCIFFPGNFFPKKQGRKLVKMTGIGSETSVLAVGVGLVPARRVRIYPVLVLIAAFAGG